MSEKILGILSPAELKKSIRLSVYALLIFLTSCASENPSLAPDIANSIIACIDINNEEDYCEVGIDKPVPHLMFEISRTDGTSMLKYTDAQGIIPIPEDANGGMIIFENEWSPYGLTPRGLFEGENGNHYLILTEIIDQFKKQGKQLLQDSLIDINT